ncbi:hypothetical protein [Aquihabitans sp. McL0605]|uniref:hypothetical protein n=1 Tax=Aquihabitans sp. McL0605 TaxID=3415671 RepID=UPI003CF70055
MGSSAARRVGHIRSLGDHWYAWTDGVPASGELRVHAAVQHDGRYHLDAIGYEGPVSASLLRTIPVGRIEAAVNALARHGNESSKGRAEARVPAKLREHAVPGYPDEFYEVVARAYRLLAADSSRPVVDIAEANDVPVTTAQRWVKEARRRELLPPGRRGKAG